MTTPTPLAIAVSDVHLSLRPPVARSAEDWLDAQDRQWRQVKQLQRKHSLSGHEPIPVIIPGDIFDRWNVQPELISFALAVLPDRCYAVYGNHDLPNHAPSELKRSAYFTLMKAGKITHLHPGRPVEVGDGLPVPLRLRGFPFGEELAPLTKNPTGAFCVDVAVVHRYCWAKRKGDHPKARPEDRAKILRTNLSGFDVALIGDNHIPFKISGDDGPLPTLVNCGTFLRRTQAERELEPSCWLIMSDGAVERIKLDCSADKWLDAKEMVGERTDNIDMEAFVNELTGLQDASENFRAALNAAMDNVNASDGVRRIVLGALEKRR